MRAHLINEKRSNVQDCYKEEYVVAFSIFFCNFRTCCLSGMRVKDREELERHIGLFIKSVNEDPVIYHWTYKMDEIEV